MPSCSSVGRELCEFFPSEAFDFRTALSAALGFLLLRRFIWSIFLAGYLRLGCFLNTRTWRRRGGAGRGGGRWCSPCQKSWWFRFSAAATGVFHNHNSSP